jgi:hypothetical protein
MQALVEDGVDGVRAGRRNGRHPAKRAFWMKKPALAGRRAIEVDGLAQGEVVVGEIGPKSLA